MSIPARAKLPSPNGYYRSLKEWRAVSPRKLRPSKKQVLTNMTGSIQLTKPIGIESTLHWLFRSFGRESLQQREGYIAVIPDGKVCGAYCDVLTPDHKLLAPFSFQWRLHPSKRDVWKAPSLPPLHTLDEPVAMLAIKDSSVYYHWMMDVLPRLQLLRNNGIHVQHYIINSSSKALFQRESLAMLGISPQQIMSSSDQLHIQSKSLIIPGFKGSLRDKWSCAFLRSELMEKHSIQAIEGFERIYISREEAGKRKIVNEREVLQHLEQYGFRKVILERLALRDQIQLFASAKVIAGPHGAGMTNMVFANPGTTIIEIFSPQLVHTCYPALSSILGHKHYYLIGTGTRPPDYVDPHNRKADITVNISQLSQLLKQAQLK
ncbi:MAG: capsular polysaccharide biosynthesis protein [Paenibacillus sp.]|nr:capsular polysaccharide biosynthesis protein [Paenibacillus sp.]